MRRALEENILTYLAPKQPNDNGSFVFLEGFNLKEDFSLGYFELL